MRLPVAQHTQAALDAHVGRSKQVGERGGAVCERLRYGHEAAALVDGDDLVAALQARRRRRAVFEHVENEGPVAGVGARAEAEADELAFAEQRVLGGLGRQVTEEAILALHPGRCRQCIEQVLCRRVGGDVDRGWQQVRKQVPLASDVEDPLLASRLTAGIVRDAAGAAAGTARRRRRPPPVSSSALSARRDRGCSATRVAGMAGSVAGGGEVSRKRRAAARDAVANTRRPVLHITTRSRPGGS